MALNNLLLQTRDLLVAGVYNDTFEIKTDGGPKCASDSTFGFKYVTSLILLPFQLYILYLGIDYVAKHHDIKVKHLYKIRRGLTPYWFEYIQGIVCVLLLAANIYIKIFTRNLIFMLNPCHVATLTFGLCSLLPFNKLTNILFSFSLAACYGAWIGIVFAENGELTLFEEAVYYIQHVFIAFLAPLVLFLGGRFSASD